MVITGCPRCGYALASANWRFRYRLGTRERTLCAGCGFEWLARRAVLTVQLGPVGPCASDTTVSRQRKPIELLRLQAQLANVRERLRAFQHDRPN